MSKTKQARNASAGARKGTAGGGQNTVGNNAHSAGGSQNKMAVMPMNGLGNGVINMIGSAIRQLVVLVPLVWVFTNFFGISYTWYAMWISEVLAFLYSFISIRKEIKKRRGSE